MTCNVSKTLAPIALTVDVEFGRGNLEVDVDWLLDLFGRYSVKATFFILGEVYQALPRLVKRITEQGHEIGFHGETHRFLSESDPTRFAAELKRCRPALEDLAQSPVRGYRAPYFSVMAKTSWALRVLADNGFGYDASIFPGWHDRYGWPQAPSAPSRLNATDFVIYPVPVLAPFLPVGFSGGGYLRILPWPLIRWAFNTQENQGRAGMIYVHPWEISPHPPGASGDSFRTRCNNALGWRNMGPRLERLLRLTHARCTSMGQVISTLHSLPVWSLPGSPPRPPPPHQPSSH